MLDFIVNPLAGGKDGKKMRSVISKLEKRLHEGQIAHSIHYTKKAGEATEFTKNLISNGATDIIVVGGDGSLHEVLNGFYNFDKVNLGLIPAGTGNDFAASINLPKDPVEALELIINGKPQYTDFMQLPNLKGMNIVGAGIDVDVLNRYNSLKKQTKFGYTMCLIKTLLNFKYSNFTANIDGKEESFCSFIAGVANGYRYGGGIPICPNAVPYDKQLNFTVIKQMPKLKIIKAFLKLKKGKIQDLKETFVCNAKEIKITSKEPITIQVDGEIYKNVPFDVKIVSDTLKFYR